MISKADRGSSAGADLRSGPPSQERGSEGSGVRDGLVERLCANLPAGGAMLPQKGEPNVYPGVLGLAQAVIVTSDSVNMASEAAITGKPVLIAPWQSATAANPSGEAGRIRAFHDHMFAGSHTAPMAGTIPNGSFERLDEMAGLTEELLTLLGR